jgi:hypothetical protein
VEPLALPPDGVLLGALGVPGAWANVSATGAARTATPNRAISKDFIPHLLGAPNGARPVPVRRVE